TADEAHRHASTWQAVYQAAVLTHLQDQLTESLQSALDQVQQAEAAFFQAQEALAAFDWEHGLSVRQARLAHLEQELTSSGSRLRALALDLLPAERACLHFLTQALAQEPPALAGLLAQVAVPGTIANGLLADGATVLNPAYFQYSEALATTATRIAAYEAEAASLQETMNTLPAEVAQVRAEVLQIETARNRLVLEQDSARARLTAAVQTRDALSPLAAQLPALARVEVVSPSILPEAPVSPRPLLNMAVAAVLAF